MVIDCHVHSFGNEDPAELVKGMDTAGLDRIILFGPPPGLRPGRNRSLSMGEASEWLAEQVRRPLKEPSPKGQGRANVTFEGYTLKWHKADVNSFDYTLRYRGGSVGVTLDEVEIWYDDETTPSYKREVIPGIGLRIEAGEDRLVTPRVRLFDDLDWHRKRTVWRGKDDNGNPVEIEFTIEINSTKPQQ